MIEPKDQKEKLQILVDDWQRFEDALSKTVRNFTKIANRFMGVFYKSPGHKKIAKAKDLAYFESISKGRSNNWRKVHGLSLARSRY